MQGQLTEAMHTLAEEAYGWLRKDDQTDRWFAKDGRPEWVAALVMNAHGDYMPEDWRYRFVAHALAALTDAEIDSDIGDIASELEPDVYTAQLTAWLASSVNRIAYCDEVAEEYGNAVANGLFHLLQLGQLREMEEVFWLVAGAIERRADETEEETE